MDASSAGWAERLLSGLARDEVADLDRPHLIVCFHPGTGITTYHGPYPNALAATAVVQHESDRQRDLSADEVVELSVAPLFDAIPSATEAFSRD
jgi:hypothetical protein